MTPAKARAEPWPNRPEDPPADDRTLAGALQHIPLELAMRLKVHNGTVAHGESSLCATCRHSIVTRGRTLDEEVVHCQAVTMGATRITFKVTSCSGYSDERQPTYLQLLEDAWILQPGSRRRPAGFTRARELREEELTSVMMELRGRRDRDG